MKALAREGRAVTRLQVNCPAETCAPCGGRLFVCEHQDRWVQRLDGLYLLVRQNKWCRTEECERFHKIQRAPVDLRFALPHRHYGLDVTVEFGERHLCRAESLRSIRCDMNRRGVPIGQRTSCALFRDFLALCKTARGDDETLRQRLRAQGGIILMADGVQFDGVSPVLYVLWDSISGEPLFGERKMFRGEDDLVPLLQRVKAMDVPVIAFVSDKEKGLVPAVHAVFPEVPHQLCQTHFLKNCALAMKDDLGALGQAVERRATAVQKIAKQLHERGYDSKENLSGISAEEARLSREAAPALGEQQLTAELCAMARHASKASGRAPLNPPELVPHDRLEAVRATVADAMKKGATIHGSGALRRR
jgi:hypothetical protein